jgi:hypothetical protein
VLSFLIPAPVSAARGTPESLEFAYGARINVHGPQVERSLYLAAELNLDWVAFDFDWTLDWPEISKWDQTTRFAQAMNLAGKLGLTVLVSVKNPPAWALTERGPEPGLSAALVSELTRRYSHLKAVELYPGANTRSGWGAVPDPAAYARLLQTVQTRLEMEKREVYLAAGGLSNQSTAPEDIPDLEFLQGLYSAGLRPVILSLQFSALTGEPLDDASASSLRHYEQIRKLMIDNGQADGLLWVTRLSPPLTGADATVQSDWLKRASEQIRSQLYVGAVYYQSLNSADGFSLVGPDLALHPFLQALSRLMGQKPVEQLPDPAERLKKLETNPLFAQTLRRPAP